MIYATWSETKIIKVLSMERLILTLLILIGLVPVACQSTGQNDIIVADVWGRPSPASVTNAAFYMNIDNNGRLQDSLEGVQVEVCENTELHITDIDDDNVMSMQHIMKIDIPVDKTVSLEPGGFHIMCLGLKSPLEAGQEIPINLSFANFGALTVHAEIREQ